MNAYYQDDACTIYHGDCREVLPQLDRVDLVLTDPPYGLDEKWTGGTWFTRGVYQNKVKWDKKIDGDSILELLAKGENLILWGGNNYPMPVSRCWLIWQKTNAVPTMGDFEMCWTNFDKPHQAFFSPCNDWVRVHPTEKPLLLIKWCLGFAPNAHTILDPFMGSGTTLRAAKDLGRKAIGIEIEEKYCEIAVKRLAQEVLF